MLAEIFMLMVGLGVSYALYAGFNPAIDGLIASVQSALPTLNTDDPVGSVMLRSLPIILFFTPIIYIVRRVLRGLIPRGQK